MHNIILRNNQCPGDVLMITGAIRDLQLAHPGKFNIAVRTNAWGLWKHNPRITALDQYQDNCHVLDMHYPLINSSNINGLHFSDASRLYLSQLLQLEIPRTTGTGEVFMSPQEKQVQLVKKHTGYDGPYWLLVNGGKFDFTAKWWNPDYYCQVVQMLKNEVVFVQVGAKNNYHPEVPGAFNLVGKTNLRDMVSLMYHADGVLCPTTFAMHLAAAVPVKERPVPAVVVAGGREPVKWESYPHHRFLHTVGELPCCVRHACWRSRCSRVGDKNPKDADDKICVDRVAVYPPPHTLPSRLYEETLMIPKCMQMVTPEMVVSHIRQLATK